MPPPEGWSLREAAAALCPQEWAAATLPKDDAEARKHPGIMPTDDPLADVLLDRVGLIVGGAYPGANAAKLGLRTDELPIVERYRAFEAEIAKRLVEARKAAERAKILLPEAFKKRMLRGDLIAYGIAPRARLDAPPTAIKPHLWTVARPHFGFDAPAVWHDHNGRPRMGAAPELDSVSGLPGNSVFRGVRIRSAKTVYQNAGSSDPLPETAVPAVKTTVVSSPDTTPATVTPRKKGGRPPRDDWPSFYQEISKRISKDGGYLTRTELRRQMKDWAAIHMSPVPADTSIEHHIDMIVHPSVYTKT